MTAQGEAFQLISLPDTVFEQTLGFLSFHEVSLLRRVSKKFNETCMRLLNQGFRSAEKFHGKCLKEVKAKLPRRESERRNHKLSRHCDILTAIETRISLLSMTFLKYVDINVCCFIPGKVLDEIFTVLRTISKDENPPRAFEILQELRDISSMAMEYFEDKIVPNFKILSPMKYSHAFSSSFSSIHMGSPYSMMLPNINRFVADDDGPSSSPLGTVACQQSLVDYPLSEPSKASRKLFAERLSRTSKKTVKRTGLIARLKKEADGFKGTIVVQNNKIVEMDKKIDSQNEIIQQQNAKIAEQTEKIAEIHRRLVGSDIFHARLKDPKNEKDCSASGRKRSIESSEDQDSKKLKMS